MKVLIRGFFPSIILLGVVLFYSCGPSVKGVPEIGFLDVIEDATLQEAREGFIKALSDNGWSEAEGNIRIIRRNAQGDVPTLIQSIQYFAGRKVDLIAANATLSTISAVQYVDDIPICMMVAPEPWVAGLSTGVDDVPKNLFGVYETLDYIDTAFQIIQEWMPDVKRVGVIYNQAETQSILALGRLQAIAGANQIALIATPVTNSSETQLVVQSLINKQIDAFFAMPDNVIFSSFEIVRSSCDDAGIPIFTSEAGLVRRGAVAAFGADFYQWGYQAGVDAAIYLSSDRQSLPPIALVQVRRSVFHPEQVERFGFKPDSSFTAINID